VTLSELRLRAALRSLRARPIWTAAATLALTAAATLEFWIVARGTRALLATPLLGELATPVLQRSLEGLYLLLASATTFSVLIAAVGILYGADDLPFLLAQPIAPARVFAAKMVELFVNAAGLPLAFTLPALSGIGVALGAPVGYHAVAALTAVALYALPVAAGSLLALLLVRIAPPGRVREVASSVAIVVAAAAVLGLRALRPERLFAVEAVGAAEFERLIARLAALDLGGAPTAWATSAVWAALEGRGHPALLALLALAGASLLAATAAARVAYARGWVRSLDGPPRRRRGRERQAPGWARALTRAGVMGAIVVNDVRAFVRDVQQWSQGLVVVALALVYFVSLAAVPAPTQTLRDALGTMNLVFVQFLIAGVALRTCFPAVSLEGRAIWLIATLPIAPRAVVLAKFLHALPGMLLVGGGLGFVSAQMIDMSPTLATAAPLAGVAAALAVTGLAVGVGAMAPRFDALHAHELASTPGVFVTMAIALGYAAATTLLLARAAAAALRQPEASFWMTAEGGVIAVAFAVVTLFTALLPLGLGAWALPRAIERSGG
jgi:ABC-2 type transport system permease protein